jgi:outer membrane lipoprotein carrier protein
LPDTEIPRFARDDSSDFKELALKNAVLWTLGLAASLVLLSPARAGGSDQLRQFLTQTKTASGEFTQRVTGANAKAGAKAQASSGRFTFQRPGKFRWTYEKPYDQVLVADGEKLYMYDKDLNQVTVKKIGAALPASPASILFGTNEFDKEFEIKDAGARDGLEWIDAKPRKKDTTFESIKIGFKDGLPAAMQLADSFGQTTHLTFARLERNPKVDVQAFKFTAPAGADVLEDK